jgi:hypothetical protein
MKQMDPAESPAWLLYGLLAVIVMVVLYRATGPRADFVVHFYSGRVDIKGKFPQAHRAALRELLVHDLQLEAPLTIRGAWKGQRLALHFHGSLGKREQQRVRNLLMSRL